MYFPVPHFNTPSASLVTTPVSKAILHKGVGSLAVLVETVAAVKIGAVVHFVRVLMVAILCVVNPYNLLSHNSFLFRSKLFFTACGQIRYFRPKIR
jgi:hypothetical protein